LSGYGNLSINYTVLVSMQFLKSLLTT